MEVSSSHPPYAMATRPTPGLFYAIAFFVCMAIIAIAFMYFLRHDFFLIHVPTIDFKLPNLHLTSG